MSDRLLNVGEIAELLGVKESWVREHTRNGDIPHVPLGRYVRYREADVLAWIDELATAGRLYGRRLKSPRAALTTEGMTAPKE
jgi:excisionase family DNA binding protein